MSNMMPSQVVQVIEKFFTVAPITDRRPIYSAQLDILQGIVILIRQIPSELISVPADQYADLVLAMAIIEEQAKLRIGRTTSFEIPHVRLVDVATVLHGVLSKCEDEFPPAQTTELLFVTDAELRHSIRQDTGAVNRAITNAEWKAATVLSGAAIEALLLWRLTMQPPTEEAITAAIDRARGKGTLQDRPDREREKWSLIHFVEVTGELALIREKTVQAARLCNSYRNLIHPGRARRLGEKCHRGTALLAVAALEHVVSDLQSEAADVCA
jgi:hypothetical protein